PPPNPLAEPRKASPRCLRPLAQVFCSWIGGAANGSSLPQIWRWIASSDCSEEVLQCVVGSVYMRVFPYIIWYNPFYRACWTWPRYSASPFFCAYTYMIES